MQHNVYAEHRNMQNIGIFVVLLEEICLVNFYIYVPLIMNTGKIEYQGILKLDGVGPIDNRTST